MRSGGVYLIGTPSGPKKIGFTCYFRARLSNIRHYQPYPVYLLESWEMPPPVAFAVEQTTHAMLWDHLIGGEWFRVSHAEAGKTIDMAIGLVDGRTWKEVLADLGMQDCERIMAHACTMEGLQRAREQGRVGGRQPEFTLEQLEEALAKGGSLRAAAARLVTKRGKPMTLSGFVKALERERARALEKDEE